MSIKPAKVGIVGAGNVGAAIANALVLLGKSTSIVLFDRKLSKAEGQAWDISDAVPLLAQMDVMPDVAPPETTHLASGSHPFQAKCNWLYTAHNSSFH